MHEATVRDFEMPARYGLHQTIARHDRRRRDLPRPAHLPGPGRDRQGHGGGLPGRVAAQLHQPDGDERGVPARRGAEAQGARPVPLGALDDARTCASSSACPSRRCPTGRPASTTRPGCCAGSGTARTCIRCWTSGSRPTPSCAGACASTCTAGSGTTRPRPASTPASTCRGTCTTPREVERLRLPVGEYVGISEENLAEYAAGPRPARRPTAPGHRHETPPSTRRR